MTDPASPTNGLLTQSRINLHEALLKGGILSITGDVVSIADKDSKLSELISLRLYGKIGNKPESTKLSGQMAGSKFEIIIEKYLRETFLEMRSLRPGKFQTLRGTSQSAVANCDQYEHLSFIAKALKREENKKFKSILGMDYIIKPDVMIVREPEDDESINSGKNIVDESSASRSSIRKSAGGKNILHASISCKWTIRSDRSQNSRSEALNLIRNRKGRTPHIVVVTAEPLPSRIASIALGTGDIDCVYHIALDELKSSIEELGYDDALELLNDMISGKRLRDISDLPLDLAT